MPKEAISYVDVSKTGYIVLAEAVLVRWTVDGVKPDPERDGEEIIELARQIYQARN